MRRAAPPSRLLAQRQQVEEEEEEEEEEAAGGRDGTRRAALRAPPLPEPYGTVRYGGSRLPAPCANGSRGGRRPAPHGSPLSLSRSCRERTSVLVRTVRPGFLSAKGGTRVSEPALASLGGTDVTDMAFLLCI
ncbi:potassium/sodium hyperpolarization-activated cyclic nucleotide-gated channel 4-like isoform X2 [Haliaeetus albicilla]|uniref:potassium/sodium hyperpolarization-activated cyclic nucleotide-gated channel 4-like isoform X2 n=1 Tax=Haliaeetus albicilla TaxID=8969 RepID=UPI0037E76B82